ncbi:MAG: class I SAM-dependent methyltransferase [Pyrinomonadaceae bacterium]
MKKLPDNFESFVEELLKEVETVEGYLAPREMRFLALLAACPTAAGEILEIGSFKGKSTIILAKSAALAGDTKINAVDPLNAPSATDPDLRGDTSSLKDFQHNIKTREVADKIEFHQTFSSELAKTWDAPLRLLWIDGDHTYKGTKLDFENFARFLNDGAIVAMHDVLHEFDGGIRVFIENVLLSPHFGVCGFCGSMAWAQFHADERKGLEFRAEKIALYEKLCRLVPFVVFREELTGIQKKRYKYHRSRIPHGAVNPQKWLEKVG